MAQLEYVKGDATFPQHKPGFLGIDFIMHCCNNKSAWGSGFVLALNSRFGTGPGSPRQVFLDMGSNPKLGTYSIANPTATISVVNIIGQDGYGRDGRQYVQYWALESAFRAFAQHRWNKIVRIHMPRMGAGLAGGKWEEIEPIILSELVARDFDVTVYDLP